MDPSIVVRLGGWGACDARRCALEGLGRKRGLMKKASNVAPIPRQTGRQSRSVIAFRIPSVHDGTSKTKRSPKGIAGSKVKASVMNKSHHPSC